MRGVLRRVVTTCGLEGPAREAMAAWRARAWSERNAPLRAQGAPDGLPIPPGRLIHLVAGSADVAWFLEGGARGAACIRSLISDAGVDISDLDSVLDFGCGCGRVTRHWAGLRARIEGCDVNPRLVAWCRRNLGFGRFATNQLDPPLPYAEGAFDLVYALSVFTHLDAARQRAWIGELRRVTRPGGHVLLSTHGTRYRERLAPEEGGRFDRGELVVKDADVAGSNLCGAYHPESYVREVLAPPLEVIALRREGALGNPYQDLWLLRRAA